MKLIDLEAHFYTQEYFDYLGRRKDMPRDIDNGTLRELWYTSHICQPRDTKLQDRLLDIEQTRLKEMDEAGVDVQVISLSNPGVQLFEPSEGTYWAKKTNDELSGIVQRHSDRFVGLASIAPQSPSEAADEVERAVTELGLKGIVILSHARNEYLDDKKYWGIFDKAEKLDIPIYLHPSIPATGIARPYSDYGYALAGPSIGFGADVALHVMRLIYSGLFDTYPKLKIILGHLGEGLPFWLTRIDFLYTKQWPGKKPALNKKPSDYLKSNFTVTTSGMFFQPAFMCTYMALGADRMAFATDYPFEDTLEAVNFIREASLGDDDRAKICYLNAERLFQLR